MIPGSSRTHVGGYDQLMSLYRGYSPMETNFAQHWYVDNGATHHVTNNLNNIT